MIPIFNEDRHPAVAGQFYPADRTKLTSELEKYLSKVSSLPKPDGDILGIIVPHAGYVFSGEVAAYSYKYLSLYNLHSPIIILIGQSHYYHLSKPAVYTKGNFLTPLGKVKIEEKFVLYKNCP